MKDLKQRLLPAIIAATVAIWLVGFPVGFGIIMSIATLGCAYEMYKISVQIDGRYQQAFLAINALMALYCVYYICHHCLPEIFSNVALSEVPVHGFIAYILLLSLLWFIGAAKSLLPLINLVYPFIGILALVEVGFVSGEYNNTYLLLLLFCVWGADMCAYFFGNLLKGQKLAPSISPNKTISGWFGAILGIGLVTVLGSLYTLDWSYSFLTIWVIVIWLSSTLGDLFESLLKRTAGMKDSGVFLPGHGGFLDRLDSLLFAAPFAYFLLQML